MKILIKDRQGVRSLDEGYASEFEFQELLRDYSELIPVEEIDLNTPSLLCIGWEVNVASGSEDLLYVDETGLLTIVETKLRRNPEARRAVVGQILEYAADAISWSPSDVEQKAKKYFSSDHCPEDYKGLTLQSALERFLEKTESALHEDFAYASFVDAVLGNLRRGHIRLVIAVDDPPPSLVRAVEFVNKFSERFEMYLLQLKRFKDKSTDQSIFVPAIFGHVSEKPRTAWTWDRYRTDLGWTAETVSKVQSWTRRLARVAAAWAPEERLYQGWTALRCDGKTVFGAQVFKRRGMDIWFYLDELPDIPLPDEIRVHMGKGYIYIGGPLDKLTDRQLLQLCKAAMRKAGIEMPGNG